MKNTSIQISDITKDLLNDLKSKFFYSTYDNCVNSIATFIINNKINPTDNSIGNFQNTLIDLEMRISKNMAEHNKKLHADNVSLRKWVGAIERDYLVPIKYNLDIVGKNIPKKVSEKEEFENPINRNINQQPKIEKSEEKIKELYQKILDKNKEINELVIKKTNQKKVLNKIFRSAKIENSGMFSKEKITIEMDVLEWEKLKNNN